MGSGTGSCVWRTFTSPADNTMMIPQVSGRIDSMKRHYESIHARDDSEDHMAHLIWGFMAVAHVVAVFPQACLDRLA